MTATLFPIRAAGVNPQRESRYNSIAARSIERHVTTIVETRHNRGAYLDPGRHVRTYALVCLADETGRDVAELEAMCVPSPKDPERRTAFVADIVQRLL